MHQLYTPDRHMDGRTLLSQYRTAHCIYAWGGKTGIRFLDHRTEIDRSGHLALQHHSQTESGADNYHRHRAPVCVANLASNRFRRALHDEHRFLSRSL